VLIPLDKLGHTIHLPTYPPANPINHHLLQLFNISWGGKGWLQHRRQMIRQKASMIRRNNSGTNSTNTQNKVLPKSNHDQQTSGAPSHR